MGLGKSLTGVALMGRLFLDGKIKRVLVVCPASVVPVWPAELEKFNEFPVDCRPLQGMTKKRQVQLEVWQRDDETLQVAVTNYEATWRIKDAILAWGADLVIADEAHRLKDPQSAQSKAMLAIGKAAGYRLALTGTPVSNSPLDFFGITKWLDQSIFGPSITAFKARYFFLNQLPHGGTMVLGPKPDMLPELVERAHSLAHRASKEDALDLPEVLPDIERVCELEPDARKVYNALVKDSIAELESGEMLVAQNVLTRILRLSQLTGGYAAGDDTVQLVSKAKIKLLAETLEDALAVPGRKVVIFARFTAEIRAIEALLTTMGHREYALIDGSVPQAVRGDVVRKFQESTLCRVLIGQERAAAEGLTLTAADTAIFYSISYSWALHDQCRARIHRIGQERPVQYVYLVAADTIDSKILKVLRGKEELAKVVVDRWREVIGR